jgi:choice-of-anchor A domain-containing protein
LGEDLTINGNYQVAIKNPGTFMVKDLAIGLLVNGKIIYKSGNSLQVNNGYVKIGDSDKSKVWYKDKNGAFSPIQITTGDYNSSPRIQLQSSADKLGVSASNNPVFEKELIKFDKAMETMRNSSLDISKNKHTAVLTDANGKSFDEKDYPDQVKIKLVEGVNYLNISGNDLNSVSVFTYENKPDADHVLVINIDADKTFNWKVWNQAGIGIDQCPFVLYNFYNTETLKIEGNNSIEGTVFAPLADIVKKKNSSNIEGQIIGQSFEQDAGENHYVPFSPDLSKVGNCSKPIVAVIAGAASVCRSASITLTNTTASGTWTSSSTAIATVNASGVVTGVAAGTATISYAVTNSCGTTTVTKDITVNLPPSVAAITGSNTVCLGLTATLSNATGSGVWSSSNNSIATVVGGVVVGESLGTANIIYTVTTGCGTAIQRRITGTISAVSVNSLLPMQLTNSKLKSYLTSPTDILGITNAKEVVSVDYTLNGSCKAVVFATTTKAAIYDHTKAVCDRLKGAQVVKMDSVLVNGMGLLRFALKYEDGHTENIISFSASINPARNTIAIQSNWLKASYVAEETMYNFQVWSVSDELSTEITGKILTQLQQMATVEPLKKSSLLPDTYFVSAKRDGANLDMLVQNNLAGTSGYFELHEKANEQSSVIIRKVPFSFSTIQSNSLQLPVSDAFETTVKMYVNNQLQDEVFLSDGAWSVDYNPATTVLNKFEAKNDNRKTVPQELQLYRNVYVNANTNTYLTLLKLMRGGGLPKDISAYQSMKFNASGNGTLKITLVKQSVKNWDDQYFLKIPLSNTPKDYLIDLGEFSSLVNKNRIKPDDINSIVFTVTNSAGTTSSISQTINNLAFSKESANYIRSLSSKEIKLFPNPSSGKFNCVFQSDKDMQLQLNITDASKGIVLYRKTVVAVKGSNTVSVDLSNSIQNLSVCILTLESEDGNYKPSSIVIQPIK